MKSYDEAEHPVQQQRGLHGVRNSFLNSVMSRLTSFAGKMFAVDSVIAVQIIGDTTGTEATVCVGGGATADQGAV